MIKKEVLNFYKPIFLKNKTVFILLILSWIISWVVNVLTPYLLKLETDQLVNKSSLTLFWTDFSWFKVFLLILAIIFIVWFINNILKWISDIFIDSKSEIIKNQVNYIFIKNLSKMEIWISQNSRYKYLKTIIESDIWKLTSTLINTPWNFLWSFITWIWLSWIYLYYNIYVLIAIIVSIVISFVIEQINRDLNNKFIIKEQFSDNIKLDKISYYFKYSFSQIALSWWMKEKVEEFKNILQKNVEFWTQKRWVDLWRNISNMANTNLSEVIIKLIVWYWVFYYWNSIWMVALAIASISQLKWLMERIIRLKFTKEEFDIIQETFLLSLNLTKSVWEEKLKNDFNKIQIKNLTFSYPNLSKYELEYINILKKRISKKKNLFWYLSQDIDKLIKSIESDREIKNSNILNWINLELQTWKIYWIVWKNWAWKTTISSLLSWLYRSYNWEILFWNQSTKNLENSEILSQIAILSQTPFFLSRMTNLRENITLWASKNITEDKIWYYLEKFWLKNKIQNNPKWLDAEIGSDIDFSGWEEQIICFIRLLLQDKKIIIMDEWTNQLDAENEILVMNELLKHKHDKIIIFVTHRMSTISKADEIYCLEDWQISDYWNHKELLQRQNAYSRFYKAQVLHDNV